MVTIINTGNSLRKMVNYNELKLKGELAELLLVCNYPLFMEETSAIHRLRVLERRAELNDAVGQHAVHISINFHSDEMISNEKMVQITTSYMNRIGLGEQPFLAYRHLDSGHPHLHVVTICIREDGSRIELYGIGRGRSEEARKALEKEYGLIAAQGKKMLKPSLESGQVTKVNYGKRELKRTIHEILRKVIPNYNYTSLDELRAVLKLYNVDAIGGAKRSLIYKKGGLLYRALDKKGNPVGVPIKASAFLLRPTLKVLRALYLQNENNREVFKKNLEHQLHFAFGKGDLDELSLELGKRNIHLVVEVCCGGQLCKAFYVDMRHRCIFDSQHLNESFGPAALMSLGEKGASQAPVEKSVAGVEGNLEKGHSQSYSFSPGFGTSGRQRLFFLSDLLAAAHDSGYVPAEWKKRKKRKAKQKQQIAQSLNF